MKKTIKFIGIDGKEYTFKTCKNRLSGNQLYWIEPLGKMFIGLKDAKNTIQDIKDSCRVISEENICDHPLAA